MLISVFYVQEHLRTSHNHLYREMDNLRDVVDDFLHVLENLKDGQRHLRDDLQNAMQQLHECLAGHGNLQNRESDVENAVRMVQATIAELMRSYDEQKMERDLSNDKLVNLEEKLNKALREVNSK